LLSAARLSASMAWAQMPIVMVGPSALPLRFVEIISLSVAADSSLSSSHPAERCLQAEKSRNGPGRKDDPSSPPDERQPRQTMLRLRRRIPEGCEALAEQGIQKACRRGSSTGGRRTSKADSKGSLTGFAPAKISRFGGIPANRSIRPERKRDADKLKNKTIAECRSSVIWCHALFVRYIV
jgi:hypothetical protein